jgi:hypothetical protein
VVSLVMGSRGFSLLPNNKTLATGGIPYLSGLCPGPFLPTLMEQRMLVRISEIENDLEEINFPHFSVFLALLESIRRNGLQTPIILSNYPNEGYKIVGGRKRLLAMTILGFENIEAVIIDPKEQKDDC